MTRIIKTGEMDGESIVREEDAFDRLDKTLKEIEDNRKEEIKDEAQRLTQHND